MSAYFRFPHTPHIAWLGAGQPRDDKVLAPADVAALLSDEVVVEEKVDGANLGLSTTEDGDLRVQNRGSYLTPQQAHPQFRLLWAWLTSRREGLIGALWPHRMLFGEWCYAMHSVRYDRLPDWFLGFDLYDREAESFVDTEKRDALLASLGLTGVPRLGRGRFTMGELERLMGGSRVGDQPMEGLIVRQERGGCTVARAKLVRASFTQAIDEHWSKGPLRKNTLAQEANSWR